MPLPDQHAVVAQPLQELVMVVAPAVAVHTERRRVSRTGSPWPRRTAFAVSAYVTRLAAVRSLAAVTVSP